MTPDELTELRLSIIERKAALDQLRKDFEPIAQTHRERVAKANEIFDKNNAEILDLINTNESAIKTDETRLRNEAINLYKKLGSPKDGKQLAEGIAVRVTDGWIYSEDDAIAYAIEHNLPTLLKLNKTAFEKYAVLLKLPMLKENPTTTAVIATK